MTDPEYGRGRRVGGDPRQGRLASALAQVQKEAEEMKRTPEKRKTKERRFSPVFLMILLVLLPVSYFLCRPPRVDMEPVPAETALRETIYITSLALESEFEETGEYPTDLETVGMDEEGMVYSRERDGYTLVAEWEGVRIQYRSGEDLEPFRAAFEALLPPFGGGR